jgi:Tfp pilus assembly protein PilE
MIVVAIIGLLAAIASSQYTQFTTRAKLLEVIQLARRDTDLLREYFHLNGEIPEDPADAGISLSAQKSRYLTADVDIQWSGLQAIVRYSVDAGGDAAGDLEYVGSPRGSDLDFRCMSADIPPRYLPPTCR